MAAVCLNAGRKELNWIAQYFVRLGGQPPKGLVLAKTPDLAEPSKRRLLYIPTQAFCTADTSEKNLKGNKINYSFQKKIEHVGRRIPHQQVQLIDENGEDMGKMHRADVLQIMDKRGLRLVLLREKAEPPVYRLMSGAQIHEERLKLEENKKAGSKTGSVVSKEQRFSTNIAQHDFETKLRQIKTWIDSKYHIRIMVQQHKVSDGPEKMLAVIDQIFASMPGKVTYLSKPRVKGRSCTCVLRPMSVKEIQQYEKNIKDKQQDKEKMEKSNADHQEEKRTTSKDEQQDDKRQKIKDEQQDNGKDLTDSDSPKH